MPTTEFAYNNSINRFNGHSPFEVVQVFYSSWPLDLVPLLNDFHPAVSAQVLVDHIHYLHNSSFGRSHSRLT